MEADSVQDMQALADVLLLWDQRDKVSEAESARERRNESLASARWRNRSSDGTPGDVLGDEINDVLDGAPE